MIFKINTEQKFLTILNGTTFAENSMKERYDIQEWVDSNPEILGEDLLIIQKEFRVEEWNQRIDLLAIDRDANLVIIELKRDHSGSTVDMQAMRYASYISTFSVERIIEAYGEYLGEQDIDPEGVIGDFIGGDFEKLNKSQRIILVAGNFDPEVMSVVLWLRDNYAMDVTVIRLQMFKDDSNFYLTPHVIVPIPEAGDFLKRREEKTREAKVIQERFSMKVGDFNDEELKERLRKTLMKHNDYKSIQWFIIVVKLLLSEDREFSRDEILQHLVDKEIATDLGTAGRSMSAISKVLSRKGNSHIRQIFSFESEGWIGSVKDNYEIRREYRDIVQEVINEITSIRN